VDRAAARSSRPVAFPSANELAPQTGSRGLRPPPPVPAQLAFLRPCAKDARYPRLSPPQFRLRRTSGLRMETLAPKPPSVSAVKIPFPRADAFDSGGDWFAVHRRPVCIADRHDVPAPPMLGSGRCIPVDVRPAIGFLSKREQRVEFGGDCVGRRSLWNRPPSGRHREAERSPLLHPIRGQISQSGYAKSSRQRCS
jgi:hypothetical protein